MEFILPAFVIGSLLALLKSWITRSGSLESPATEQEKSIAGITESDLETQIRLKIPWENKQFDTETMWHCSRTRMLLREIRRTGLETPQDLSNMLDKYLPEAKTLDFKKTKEHGSGVSFYNSFGMIYLCLGLLTRDQEEGKQILNVENLEVLAKELVPQGNQARNSDNAAYNADEWERVLNEAKENRIFTVGQLRAKMSEQLPYVRLRDQGIAKEHRVDFFYNSFGIIKHCVRS